MERLKKTFQRRGSMGRILLDRPRRKAAPQNKQSANKIRIRMSLGYRSLRSSLKTMAEIYPTRLSLIEYLHTYAILNLNTETLKVEPYYMETDSRVGWPQTYIVTCPLYGVLAFTDGPIN
jgi:hypothetical protein